MQSFLFSVHTYVRGVEVNERVFVDGANRLRTALRLKKNIHVHVRPARPSIRCLATCVHYIYIEARLDDVEIDSANQSSSRH